MFGGAIPWSVKKQPIIALSTTEPEYLAATHATKEAAWIRDFFEEINQLLADPITLFCNNQSAITLTKDGQYHTHTKHISTQYHFICEMVENCIIVLAYCPTTMMVTDMLTKPLPHAKFKSLVHELGLYPAWRVLGLCKAR